MDGGGGFFAEEDYDPDDLIPAEPQRGVPHRPWHEADTHDEEGERAMEEMLRQEQGLTAIEESAAGPSSAGDPAQLGKCVDCKEREGQPKFFEAFGLSICFDCQRAGKGPGGKYQVVTKSKAKDEYLLTDRQLSKERGGLGCLTVPNPRDSRYGDMRLYLRTQVEALALQAWGSDEALFDEKERRVQERLVRADAKKRKAAAGPPGATRNPAKRGAGIGSAAIARHREQVAAVSHTHTYRTEDETYDEASDTWTKTCTGCGFQVTYEKI